MNRQEMYSKWYLISHCLKQRCIVDDEWQLNVISKWLYAFKIIICIMFNRRWHETEWNWLEIAPVTVAMHSFKKEYNHEVGQVDANFVLLQTGYGLRNWYFYEIWSSWL